MAVFPSARPALHAAIALQERVAKVGSGSAGIGLDAGEAIPVVGGYGG